MPRGHALPRRCARPWRGPGAFAVAPRRSRTRGIEQTAAPCSSWQLAVNEAVVFSPRTSSAVNIALPPST
eukprot:5737398-Lingulodinium_polyedra.AAC.1